MPAQARFNGIFVDEDTLGVAYELERTHPGEIYYVGHPDMPEIPRSTKDPALLAALGANANDFIFLTRDKRIRRNSGERQQLMSAAIRAVFLSGRNDIEKSQMVSLVEKHWNDIVNDVGSQHGPALWSLTQGNGLRRLP